MRLPPVLRDVCKNCNNVALSNLDSHVSILFKKYFLVPVTAPHDVTFEYEYKPLHRWLLKVLYNSARADRDRLEGFREHIPYILGTKPEPNTHSVVLVGIFEASTAEPQEIAAGLPATFAPMLHSFGKILFQNTQWPKVFMSVRHAIGIVSYFFVVIAFCDGTPSSVRREIITQILNETRFIILDPGSSKVLINKRLGNARDYLLNKERTLNARYMFSEHSKF